MAHHLITVRAKPRSKTRSIIEVGPWVYEIRTKKPPDKGKANEDIVDILAEHLGVPKTSITLLRGATSKTKMFKITA
jgi:uncharacterized protein